MTTTDSTFAMMQTEWRSVRAHARSDIGHWEQRRVQLEQEEAGLRDRGRWTHGRADYLGVLLKQRDELTHSQMIAWLLDPCARHGLGTRMLAGLLKEIFPTSYSLSWLERACTLLEVPLPKGRLDIVVKAPGLYLVIENKVDADEGDGQCAYYYEYVRGQHPNALFILLSPDGRRAQGAEAAEAFKPLTFKQLAVILSRALTDVTSEAPGRRIAGDYLSTLDMEFYDD